MTEPARHPEDIFEEIIALPAGERPARLSALCGDDAGLRSEIETLVEAWEASGDFLERPADLVLAPDEPESEDGPDLAGSRIGSWILERRLGAGGSGDVWLAARDIEGARQQAALKLIRGAVLAPDAMRRFRNECRVLARLDHPNIARLIEGGVTPEGTPYLAVEYVEGETIDAWCDRHDPDTRARVALLLQACGAVRHLHRHSVIHRDLKPGNILVADAGRVKLIDFGIARALDLAEDESEHTLAGFERMTPAYASPEQLRGDLLTNASDVYSLGVVAYRLLAGRLPYAATRRWDLEKEITHTRLRPPSEVARPLRAGDLKGDLDTILLQALRREPERRYASVNALMDDLQRHLDGRAVAARGDSFPYLAGRFMRRHTAAVTAAALLVLVLVGAAVTGFTLYERAEGARRDAESQRATAEEVRAFLEKLLSAVDPTGQGARADITVREALAAASDRVGRELAHQPAVAASLHLTIGDAYANLALYGEAERHFLAAEALYGPERLDDPLQAGRAAAVRGEVYHKQGRYADAESLLVLVLAARREPQPGLDSRVHRALSQVLTDQSRLDEAAVHAERAVALAQETTDEPVAAVQTVSNLGVVRFRQGRQAEAESLMAAGAELARRTLGPEHVLVGECTQNLGAVANARGRPLDAVAAYSEALRIYRIAYPADHPEFGVTLMNLADAEMSVGRYAEAHEHYAESLRITGLSLGREHLNWALNCNGLANALRQLDQPARADSLFGLAVAGMAGSIGERHPWTAVVRVNRARLWLEEGRVAEAEALAGTALADMTAGLPADHVYLARPVGVLAEAALVAGRGGEAAALLERFDALTAGLPPDGSDRFGLGLLQARLLAAQGDRPAAAALLDSLTGLADAGGEATRFLVARVAGARDAIGPP